MINVQQFREKHRNVFNYEFATKNMDMDMDVATMIIFVKDFPRL